MNKKLATLGITVGLAAGGVAGLALGAPGVSNAVTSATVAAVADTTTADTTTDETRPDRAARLAEILAPLVSDGTITQAQADSVIAALEAAAPLGGRGERGPGLEAAATALGMTEDELRTELRAGSSVADIAAAKGVDVQTVIDSVVVAATDRINARVADGSITQEQADARLANLEARVTAMVNGERPAGGGRGGRGGHFDDAAGTQVDEAATTTVG